jgi:sigma-B regulation protein RsbU (phosphoserine phosphatase)
MRPFLRRLTGRTLLIGITLKVVVFVWVAFGLQSAGVLPAIDGAGDACVLVGVAGFAAHLLRLARRHLLWRVRQQLILSYIFIGVIPALLLVAFFLLAGVLLFANIASYLIQARVRTLIDEVRVVAQEAGRDVGRATTADAVSEAAGRFVEARSALYPAVSLTLALEPGRCRGDRPGRAPTGLASAGPWGHLRAPTSLPVWVSCDGYAGVLTSPRDGDGSRPPAVTVRAIVPVAMQSGRVALIVDVPLGGPIWKRLGEETGTQIGGMTALPAPGSGDPDPDAMAEDSGSPVGAATSITDLLRWVAFLDHTEWASGQRGTVGVAIGFNIRRLYARISATPLASLGNFSFGQLLLAGLLIVAALFLIIQSVAFVIGIVLARSITGSVHDLFEGTERVRAGDFRHKIHVHRRDQLGELAESFNTMTASIETLLVEREEKQRLEQELAIARQIQMSLLPQGPLRLPGIVVSAHCEPAREVGGDYYDFLPLGPTRAGMLIADVAGKGTSAALYMAELKGVVHSLSRTAGSPRDLLIEANRIIAPHLDYRSFITMTYAVVDSEARTFTYARAGHCPLVYMHGPDSEGSGRASIMAPDGMVLGLKLDGGEMFERILEEATLPLATGDVLVLFTDGISEAMNGDGDCFGESRLLQIVEEQGHAEVDDLREHILREIERFSGGAPQHDDMTMLVLKVGARVP